MVVFAETFVEEGNRKQKEKLMKSVVDLSGASIVFYLIIGIIYNFQLDKISGTMQNFFQTLISVCMILGLVYSIWNFIHLMQFRGNLSKDKTRKLVKKLGIVAVFVLIFALLMILLAVGVIG